MQTDICGIDVSLDDFASVDAWNKVICALMSHTHSAGKKITALVELAPEFALGHAVQGLACLLLARKELVPVARAASARAHLAMSRSGATAREREWVFALDDWLSDRPSLAVERMETCLSLAPNDTISMKMSQALRFILGDAAGMLWSATRAAKGHGADHPLYGYAQGCLAFALEETGDYEGAETAGLRALAFAHDDAWGLHAVAHVYDMTHQVEAGIVLIDNNQAAWTHCNNFRFHVWWHKALLHFDKGDYDRVLALYDQQVRREPTDDYRDFSNASSLLMRLELEGIAVGERWQELADLAEKRIDDGQLTFADMHYMMALTQDKRHDAARGLIANVNRIGQEAGETAPIMKQPGQNLAAGLMAFSAARYEQAFACLAQAQPHFQAIGGSHAQRDVFERLTIEAGLRAGRLTRTRELIVARQVLRGGALDSYAEQRLMQISAIENVQQSQVC